MAELMVVKKELMEHMMTDFECLLEDMEAIVDESIQQKVDQRLEDIKKGKIKGYTEKEFIAFMKEEGVNV